MHMNDALKAPIRWASSLSMALAGALALSAPATALASEIEVMALDDGSKVIFLTGEITEGDGAQFRRTAAEVEDALVVLESEGGSTMEALEIGETIRLKGFSTLVVNDTVCVSACGLIWLSGTPRTITQSGQVGFHASYTDDHGRKLESGVGNALVGRYLALLNLSRKAIVFATSASPDSFNWLTASNASSFGIDVHVADDFIHEAEPAASAPPEPVQPPPRSSQRREMVRETTDWGEVDGWVIRADHSLDDSCFAMRLYEDDTVLRIGTNVVGNNYYFLFGNPNWSSLRQGQSYDLKIQFDNLAHWDATAVGVPMGDLVALWINFSDTNFWGEFGVAQGVAISRNGKQVGSYELDGSYKAVEMVIACQKNFNQARQSGDPFAE